MVEQLVDTLAPLDVRVAEQVIEVPKIVCPHRAARTVLGAPQTVEQLVEAACARFLLLRSSGQPVEDLVDIPLRAWGGTGWTSSRFSPWTVFFLVVDIPVPHGGPHLQDPGLAIASSSSCLGWREARALFEQLAARPGRDTNTGHRDGG